MSKMFSFSLEILYKFSIGSSQFDVTLHTENDFRISGVRRAKKAADRREKKSRKMEGIFRGEKPYSIKVKEGDFMQYTTYYEEQQKFGLERYAQIKQMLQKREPRQKFESFELRKLRFQGTDANDAIPQYYLCVKNQDETQIYLEKKYIQNRIWHRACAQMSREECERILRGDIQWMQGHKEALFEDFYLQATLNHLSPGNAAVYRQEVIRCREGWVIFGRSVDGMLGGSRMLLEPSYPSISCQDDREVLMTYRKRVSLPAMLREMLQSRETVQEELTAVF